MGESDLFPVLKLWDGGHFDGHLWRWLIMPPDFARSTQTIVAECLPRDNINAWVILSTREKGNTCLTKLLSGFSYERIRIVIHLHTWRQNGRFYRLPYPISLGWKNNSLRFCKSKSILATSNSFPYHIIFIKLMYNIEYANDKFDNNKYKYLTPLTRNLWATWFSLHYQDFCVIRCLICTYKINARSWILICVIRVFVSAELVLKGFQYTNIYIVQG